MCEEQIKELSEYVLEKFQEKNGSLNSYCNIYYYNITNLRKLLKSLGLFDMAKLSETELYEIKTQSLQLADDKNREIFLSTIKEKILNWIVLCQEEGWQYTLSKNKNGLFDFEIFKGDRGANADGYVNNVNFYETVTQAIEERMEEKRIKQEEANKKLAALNKLTEEERKLLGLK